MLSQSGGVLLNDTDLWREAPIIFDKTTADVVYYFGIIDFYWLTETRSLSSFFILPLILSLLKRETLTDVPFPSLHWTPGLKSRLRPWASPPPLPFRHR